MEPSNSRESSPCCAVLAREAQVRLPKRSDVASPVPRAGRGIEPPRGSSSGRYGQMREVLMRYKPKNVAALHIALAGLPDKMRVELDPDIGMAAKTVAELRNVTAWPENFVMQPLRNAIPKMQSESARLPTRHAYHQNRKAPFSVLSRVRRGGENRGGPSACVTTAYRP